MKKIFLFGAMLCAVLTANAGASLNQPGEGGDPAPAAAPAAATLTGKWHVLDMKFLVAPPGGKMPDQATVTAMVVKQNGLYEFTTDGKVNVTANNKLTAGTYKKTGNKIETTGPKGEKEIYEIITLTDKVLTIKVNQGKMLVMMERA
ncbi:hypothetical protein CJD36_011825 [Flavipsychrobacter stenotrophus]|uniref:Lipocalin-like domain-containing protein n=1 Tax=Flavipsychrobacter stenotrophus TaxID=2077091 RepID=A0A2S7SVM5_9BACT|nr:lipocalin family protein [Flavipsychrobacter stenotrophus]PQJ10655.1 hypothetical protein CJD36_011825 [Flavipsychrobacter stenotrophus]